MTYSGWYALKPNHTKPNHIYLIYMYEEDSPLNYLQTMIYHETHPNKTMYIYIYIYICKKRIWYETTDDCWYELKPNESTSYICIYVVPSISFQPFFVRGFKIVVDSWKFTLLLQYILWDDWPIFMISGSNEQLQQELGYTQLKPDCHSWWISKMQSGREETLEERYAIKFCFKLGKISEKWMECFRLILDNVAWIGHQFLSSIRDSRKPGSLWGMMRGVGGVRKTIHCSWLAMGLRFGLLCWGFKGVQEEIPSEAASTLQIESVAFPPGQYTSPQLHSCHRLFDQDGHQDSSSSSL